MGWNKPDHILPFVSMSLKKIEKLEAFEVNRIRIRVYWLATELNVCKYYFNSVFALIQMQKTKGLMQTGNF